MPTRVRYQQWTRQPPEAQPLDRSSALAASVGVYAPYALRDVRGLVSPIASSGVSPTTYGSGVGARSDGSANARLDFGSYETVGASNCTWSTLVRFDSLTPSYTAVLSWIATGATDYVQLLVTSAGKLAVYVKSAAGTPSYDGTGAYTLQVGRTYRLSLVLPSSGPVIAYVDGREDNRTASTTLNYGAGLGGTVFVGHDAITSGRNLSGVVNDIAFFRRALSPAEVWQLASGPAWQLFAPRRLLVPVAAGGIPTLSAATVFAITANSAQPRVTVTF